ncbi:MAG: metal-dependent hydrolase [Microbacteriaceae bacterium]
MTLSLTDTVVEYPDGATSSESIVTHTVALADGRLGVVLDRTACHPLAASWPDQGPDRGMLIVGSRELPIVDCLVGATDGLELFIGSDVPVRTGTEGWAFVVVHVVEHDSLDEGSVVRVAIDAEYRAALSAGHTACHLASLALNRALDDTWTKDAATDALGARNFDSLAIERSLITPNGSRDDYRIGKSLRKKGFNGAAFDSPSDIEQAANHTLAEWIAAGGAVHIERSADGLGALRTWVCELPGGEARIPCGGTHVASLAELSEVSISLAVEALEGALGVTMTTSATRAQLAG